MQLESLDFILEKAFSSSGFDVDEVGICLDLDGRDCDLIQVSGFDLDDFLASQRKVTCKVTFLMTIVSWQQHILPF